VVKVTEVRAPEIADKWRMFVRESNNGTLFHDLDFLAYHPPDRFSTHHLKFESNQNTVALMPAAIVAEPDGRRMLKSPYGGSVGGPVIPIGQHFDTTFEIVQALREYVRLLGLDGVEIRLAPSVYMQQPNENLGFALIAQGFQLRRRWLCPFMFLPDNPAALLDGFVKTTARKVRSAIKSGLAVRQVDCGRVDEFYSILLEDKANHKAVPTHTFEEVVNLLRRLPQRVRLFLCEKGDQPVAGMLLLMLNPRVAYAFYLCQRNESRKLHPAPFTVFSVARELIGEGVPYLDLGPSTEDDMVPNNGVTVFKERLGARGFCRDTWVWQHA
jgi:hypothetical protein